MPSPRAARFVPKMLPIPPADLAELQRLEHLASTTPDDPGYLERLAAWRARVATWAQVSVPAVPQRDPAHPKAIALAAAEAFRLQVLRAAQRCSHCGARPIRRADARLCRECHAHA